MPLRSTAQQWHNRAESPTGYVIGRSAPDRLRYRADAAVVSGAGLTPLP